MKECSASHEVTSSTITWISIFLILGHSTGLVCIRCVSDISLSLKLDLYNSSCWLKTQYQAPCSTSSSLAVSAASKHDGIILRHLIASSKWDANLLSISDFKWSRNSTTGDLCYYSSAVSPRWISQAIRWLHLNSWHSYVLYLLTSQV